MKISLNQKELKKTYSLLDTKEINMSIADMLFSTFEEKSFFMGSKNVDDFFNKLLSFWGLDGEAYEDIRLLEKVVKPCISQLNNDFLQKNPYYKTINPKPIKQGKYSLEYIAFNAYQPFSLNDIEVDEKDNYLERSPLSYFTTNQKYLALTVNGEVWMSITPNEINTMEKHIQKARGDVLVLGLGLGYYPFMISQKDEVKNITIVEMDQNIIDLFNKFLLPLFPHKEKIHIVKGDAIDYLKKDQKHHDVVFADLWHNPEDGLPLYLIIKHLEKKNTLYQYWLEESLIAMYRRCLLTVYEESLNNYSDKDYQKAKNDIDKIINDIYFKTKNITINSYDDIYNLLSKESILKLL